MMTLREHAALLTTGVKGARIVLADWKGDDSNLKIDGKKYKADTWYTMKEGKIVELTEDKAKEE